jgi:hypothetical protein
MFKLLEESLTLNKLDLEKAKDLLESYLLQVNNFSTTTELVIKQGNLIMIASKVYQNLCEKRAKLLTHSTKTISWRNVLEFKRNIGWFADGRQEAKSLGYPYFLWNDLIYASDMDGMIPLGSVADLG